MTKPSRGEVWHVGFDPSIGSEIEKTRPAVVLNIDSVGKLPLRIVVPITEWKPHYAGYPWIIHLPASVENGLSKDSGADAFQVKSVSESRFKERLGSLAKDDVSEIAAAIALCVGYDP